MPMPYEHLFFDLDHTLWDFDANSRAVWEKLYLEHSLQRRLEPDFEVFYKRYQHHNDVLWERFRQGTVDRETLRWKRIYLTLLDFRQPSEALSKELGEAYLALLPRQQKLMDGALELLQFLHGNYQLHLITNGFETTQWQKLESSGIAHFFKEVFTSERCERPKPHREIFDFALKTCATCCEHSLMIGDALEADVLGAQNAGWHAAYYTPEGKPHTEKPEYEIAHLLELKKILHQ